MTRRLSAWRVSVAAHELAGRWEIAEQVLEVVAIDGTQARVNAARQVHRAAGVSPWLPVLRTTYTRTSATLVKRLGADGGRR